MKKQLLLTVLSLSCAALYAQEDKLKTVQASSVWAPAGIKVDGNLKEWDDTFQAYNKTTKMFYTISNDNEYLYLVVKSIDVPNSAKIIAGGITLTVNTEGKKKDKDAFMVTYPVIPRPTRGQGGRGGNRGGGAGGFGGGAGGDRRDRNAPLDSAALELQHKQTIEAAKEIRVLGFKAITDTSISIYNEFSIKAALGYDKIGNYDYELAIPLKLMNIDPTSNKELAYNIKVNGIQIPANFADNNRLGGASGDGGFGGGAGGGRGGGGGGGRGGRGGGGGGAPAAPGTARDPEMYSPTDFWGKYTLAKK